MDYLQGKEYFQRQIQERKKKQEGLSRNSQEWQDLQQEIRCLEFSRSHWEAQQGHTAGR